MGRRNRKASRSMPTVFKLSSQPAPKPRRRLDAGNIVETATNLGPSRRLDGGRIIQTAKKVANDINRRLPGSLSRSPHGPNCPKNQDKKITATCFRAVTSEPEQRVALKNEMGTVAPFSASTAIETCRRSTICCATKPRRKPPGRSPPRGAAERRIRAGRAAPLRPSSSSCAA